MFALSNIGQWFPVSPGIYKKPAKRAAVVIPLSTRPELTPSEKLSLHHLETYLGTYDKFFIAPPNHPVTRAGYRVERFEHQYFGNPRRQGHLMMQPSFYLRFLDYDYILLYHLDALVFSDQLSLWCDQGYDYIGSAWVDHPDAPYYGMPDYKNKAGCGGFSLRRVRSFLRVLQSSQRPYIDPEVRWREQHAHRDAVQRLLRRPERYLKSSRYSCGPRAEIRRWKICEDVFWVSRAPYYRPDFKVAPFETGIYFGTECVPKYCYQLTNETLPFGCHAWERWDRDFWKTFLLQSPE